jgi:uncharacterized membrane protein
MTTFLRTHVRIYLLHLVGVSHHAVLLRLLELFAIMLLLPLLAVAKRRRQYPVVARIAMKSID